MGGAKNYWMEQSERGYSVDIDDGVCPACVNDPFLQALLADHLGDVSCHYCGAETAAPVEVLYDAISEAILRDYTDPGNELYYESREGGYQGQTWDGWDVVERLSEWTENSELLEDTSKAFSDGIWCEQDPYGLTPYRALSYGWAEFERLVRRKTRFLFFTEDEDLDYGDPRRIRPQEVLDALGNLFQTEGMFSVAPIGTAFIRARVCELGKHYARVEELGTAPHEAAVQPNRMSPAGIPMFYGALDPATAVLETLVPDGCETVEVALARFDSVRPLCLLDLTKAPPVPSDFDAANSGRRGPLRFLRELLISFTRPIARDDRAHSEYVPTQIFTEYVRYRLKSPNQESVDGILYRSSRIGGKVAAVLFVDPEECGPREPPKGFSLPRTYKLTLSAVSHHPATEFMSLFEQ